MDKRTKLDKTLLSNPGQNPSPLQGERGVLSSQGEHDYSKLSTGTKTS